MPEIPQVVDVTFSGTAGEPDSRFIIIFDEPVFVTSHKNSITDWQGEVVVEKEVEKEVPLPGEIIVVEKEVVKEVEVEKVVEVEREVIKEVEVEKVVPVEDVAYAPHSKVALEIGNLRYGSTHRLPLQTQTSPDNPSRELSFGPVEREFALASRILLDGYAKIADVDGNQAALDFRNVINTVFVNPDYADDITDPELVNCVAFMEGSGFPGPLVRHAKTLRSDDLSDDERIDWRSLLSDGYSPYLGDPCLSLWSEPISADNATKRNYDFPCTIWLREGSQLHQDAIELIHRPYTDLDASDRIQLTLVLSADQDLLSDCSKFYPQLFHGRWIPMKRN